MDRRQRGASLERDAEPGPGGDPDLEIHPVQVGAPVRAGGDARAVVAVLAKPLLGDARGVARRSTPGSRSPSRSLTVFSICWDGNPVSPSTRTAPIRACSPAFRKMITSRPLLPATASVRIRTRAAR